MSTVPSLEGKYIVFQYAESDINGEGETFLLYKLEKDELKSVYFPPEVRDPALLNKSESLEEIIRILHKNSVNEVYSVFHFTEPFFDIPKGWYSTELGNEYAETDPIEDWAEYKPLFADDLEVETFLRAGIHVKFYDWDKKSIVTFT